MAWRCSGNTNEELVNNMAKNGLIEDERVKRAMLGVSGDFVEHISANPTTQRIRIARRHTYPLAG